MKPPTPADLRLYWFGALLFVMAWTLYEILVQLETIARRPPVVLLAHDDKGAPDLRVAK